GGSNGIRITNDGSGNIGSDIVMDHIYTTNAYGIALVYEGYTGSGIGGASWTGSHAYAANAVVSNGSNYYQCAGQTATATGSGSGTTLTVSGVSGTIAIGDWVLGTGINPGTSIVSGSG